MKYGYLSFKLEILEYCDINNLLKREQYYLDYLKPEYNVLKVAGSMLRFKHSEYTRKLFHITRLGRIFSETARPKMSLNNHKSISVILTNIKTGNTINFRSKSKAAKYLGVSETTVRNSIKLNKSCEGYIIMIG